MGEPSPKKAAATIAPAPESLSLKAIQEAIQSIRHGVVQIIIQDGRIIQIDKTEKIRLV